MKNETMKPETVSTTTEYLNRQSDNKDIRTLYYFICDMLVITAAVATVSVNVNAVPSGSLLADIFLGALILAMFLPLFGVPQLLLKSGPVQRFIEKHGFWGSMLAGLSLVTTHLIILVAVSTGIYCSLEFTNLILNNDASRTVFLLAIPFVGLAVVRFVFGSPRVVITDTGNDEMNANALSGMKGMK